MNCKPPHTMLQPVCGLMILSIQCKQEW